MYPQRCPAAENQAHWLPTPCHRYLGDTGRWEARQEALVAAGQPRSRVSELVAAALDAAHRGLPLPLRNVAVPGDAAAPLGEGPAAAFQVRRGRWPKGPSPLSHRFNWGTPGWPCVGRTRASAVSIPRRFLRTAVAHAALRQPHANTRCLLSLPQQPSYWVWVHCAHSSCPERRHGVQQQCHILPHRCLLTSPQGAVGVLGGLLDHTNTEVPLAELPFHGSELPPLISRAVPLPPPSSGQQQGPSDRPPARRAPWAGEPPRAGAPSQLQQQQQQQPALAMLPLLPSSAPFAAPPCTPGVLDAFRGPLTGGMLGAGVGAGGVGGLLFSVGTGAVAAGGVGAFPAGDARNYKRSKPNDWLL